MLLLGILLASGCMKVGPNFSPPPVALSKDWMDAEDRRLKTDSAEIRNWWQAFNDPALDQLIDTAYRENLTLRIAGVRVLEARAQLGCRRRRAVSAAAASPGPLDKIRISDRSPQAIGNPQLQYLLNPRSA